MKKIIISDNWRFWSPEKGEEMINLPHDYSIRLPRNPKAAGGASNGFFEGGMGKYTKYLKFGDKSHYILDIDGAYMCARISFNDNMIDMHPYGYTPYLVDLSSRVRNGRNNKIEITTQNLQPSTRWYSGSGIYRDVYLWYGGKTRIEPRDLFITTTELSGGNAKIKINAVISSDDETSTILDIKIYDNNDILVQEMKENYLLCDAKTNINLDAVITDARLWSTESPSLYRIVIDIIVDGTIEDSYETHFGVRTISADAEHGLRLNGKKMKLKGGCIHHDHGGLGSAEYPAAVRRKLKLLKSVGFNAVRISHYPPSEELLNACDEIGLLVMDEAFDMWNIPKNNYDYSMWFRDWWERDISYMVLRDRKHPSVISYSVGNEIPERDANSDGAIWAKRIADEIRKYDNTRLITSGICEMWGSNILCDESAPDDYKEDFKRYFMSGMDADFSKKSEYWALKTEEYAQALDIVGYNYLYERYADDHDRFPQRVIWGSETHALNFAKSWKTVMENEYVIGDFTWTAYDNLGEAGTGRFAWARDEYIPYIGLADYPWRACYQGDFDLCGFRRPQSYFRETVWVGNTEPHIFTTHPKHNGEGFSGTGWHWYDVNDTWTYDDEYIGMPIKTDVYTDADEIEFVLNDKSLGKVKPQDYIASMDIAYEKGTLTAIAYAEGEETKRYSLTTTEKAQKIAVTPETKRIQADGRDLCYIDIVITDAAGNRVPYADNEIECRVYGGKLMCVFSGNPNNEDDYTANKCHVHNGRAVAVVSTEQIGTVKVEVSANNLEIGWSEVSAKSIHDVRTII